MKSCGFYAGLGTIQSKLLPEPLWIIKRFLSIILNQQRYFAFQNVKNFYVGKFYLHISYDMIMQQKPTRGCPIIIRTDFLLHTSKTIAPRVKSWARGQNNWSRALKWGIVHLCSSSTFWDTTDVMKMWVFQFLRFCKKMMILLYKNAKNAKT